MPTHTVLIVDDQPVNRMVLSKILSHEYNLLEAENGAEALEVMRANEETISAVILDIVMPVMDGYQVLNTMRLDHALSKIPVIVSSQKDGDEAEERALELGAQDFIAKPYKANIILHRLFNIIRLRETAAMINRVEKDELTGLLSKQFFMERVEEVLQANPEQNYDIVCLDVEHFKMVNDTYGIETGDRLLKHIGEVLLEEPLSVITSRFTSDHFYTLVPTQEKYSDALFEHIINRIRDFPIAMEINVNFGIYQIQDRMKSISAMCDRAKLAGDNHKGQFDQHYSIYDNSMRQKLVDEQFMAASMQKALVEHQFVVYYQPKYDLNNERLAGAEALVRWIHPDRGFMSPGQFIPFFEKNGFITALDQYVWEAACKDIRSWIDAKLPPVAISVNVSRADVFNPKLTDILLGLVAKYQIPIRYLHLEITESAYTNNPKQIISVVSHLRELGFIIEMDDFGSGYSSLNMLAEMPVDVMKLDMGFVQHETKNSTSKGIMSFAISLAKWMNLAVVAEGVETAEQIAVLRSMDCNYVQGFYFAKPMPKDQFEELLRTGNVTNMICSAQTATEVLKEEAVPEASPIVTNRTMLVVDDIEINRAVLASIFEDKFHIVEKENGKEAWDYLQEHGSEVTVVLLDLLMPVMDGFQLLERIRNEETLMNLPVIITSQGNSDSELRALHMQADDFISKPYNPEIVVHRVYTAIEVRYLHALEKKDALASEENKKVVLSTDEKILKLVDELKPYFDVVRLVDPANTIVCPDTCGDTCETEACYSVWGKVARCNNCISLKALREHSRYSKLEFNKNGLYFVVSQYVPYGPNGAALEVVTKLEDNYIDNILDKPMLYSRLDSFNQELNIDSLTGIYNRRYIDGHLQLYIQSTLNRESDLGIAMVDLDNFKFINDTYGHTIGDLALKTVAGMLHDNIAISKGDFVARYGGDEFLVVCKDIGKDIFTSRLNAVTKLVNHISTPEGISIPVSISVGCISLSEIKNPTDADVINLADQRLYEAKDQGHGHVVNQ